MQANEDTGKENLPKIIKTKNIPIIIQMNISREEMNIYK